MGWDKGSTDLVNTTATDLQPLRQSVIDFLMGPYGSQGGQPGGITRSRGGSTPAWQQPGLNNFDRARLASQAKNQQTNAAGVPSGGTNVQAHDAMMRAINTGTRAVHNAGQGQGQDSSPTSWAQNDGPISMGPEGTITHTGNQWGTQPGGGGGNPFWNSTMPMLGPGGPDALQGHNRIFGQTYFAGINPNVPYVGDSSRVQVGQTPDIDAANRGDIRDVNKHAGADDVWSFVMSQLGLGGQGVDLGQGPQLGRSQQAGFQGTQSVDQLGGANSAFFQNMMNQYQPAFTQQRADSLAQAKESMGNLTGSGAGNTLGAAMNRSLGAEQAMLAELAKWGVGTEVGRQSQLAGINAGIDVANMNAQNQRDITGASLQNTRDISGAQLGQQQLGNMLGTATTMMGQDMQRQGMNQGADQMFMQLMNQINMANQGTRLATNQQQGNIDLAQMLQNQNLRQGAANQSSAQGVDLSKFNAGQANALSAQNAQNFLQMLMGMLGQNNTAIQQNPSIFGQMLGAGTQLGAAALGACWVAEELYGADDQRTHDARRYVLAYDTPFTALYKQHGRLWAQEVKRFPEIRSLVQPIWDRMAEYGRILREAA